MASILIHIVTYHSSLHVRTCIESLITQQGFGVGENLQIELTDNASDDHIVTRVSEWFPEQVTVYQNQQNLGFCGAHNQAVARFLAGNFDYLLILNPDTRLAPGSLTALVSSMDNGSRVGMATPLLMRCDEELQELSTPVVDAAGMYVTSSLRHFDRGSGLEVHGNFMRDQHELGKAGYVFGGTGACLLISRACVNDLILPPDRRDAVLWSIYPQLRDGSPPRAQLFDEAFFAYREDADLAWRAQLRGWRIRFTPEAVVYHQRRVLPERRNVLPAELNRLGVRNRFLLQASNMTWGVLFRTLVPGVLWRNTLVLLATLLCEHSSIQGLREAALLLPRALARRRRHVSSASPGDRDAVARWFSGTSFIPLRET